MRTTTSSRTATSTDSSAFLPGSSAARFVSRRSFHLPRKKIVFCIRRQAGFESQAEAPIPAARWLFLLTALHDGKMRVAQLLRLPTGWKPRFFLANVSTSGASVLKPAGLQYAKDVIDGLSDGPSGAR